MVTLTGSPLSPFLPGAPFRPKSPRPPCDTGHMLVVGSGWHTPTHPTLQDLPQTSRSLEVTQATLRVLGIFREALGFVWKRTQHRNHHQLKPSQGSCDLSWVKDMPERWFPSGHGMQDFHDPTRKRLTRTRPPSTSGPGGPGSPFSPCEASKGQTGGPSLSTGREAHHPLELGSPLMISWISEFV